MANCIHGRRQSRCKECGGASICVHQRIKIQCVPCGGSQICAHRKYRSACKECGGGAICKHDIRRVWCFICAPLSFARNRLLFFRTQAKRLGHALPKITSEALLSLMRTSPVCFGCRGKLNWEAKTKPHLHHSHKTGQVFGFCHPLCNQAEGMIAKLTPQQRLNFFRNFFPGEF